MESTATIHVPAGVGSENVGLCGRCGPGVNNFRLKDGTPVEDEPDRLVYSTHIISSHKKHATNTIFHIVLILF